MNTNQDYEHDPIREAAIIRLQMTEEVEQANHEYEKIKPAKIIVTTEKNNEVQCDTLPF
jgi:ribosomal protein L2